MTAVLYPYQRRYLADPARFKAGMWSRQTGKTFTTTLEAVLDVLEAEAEGRVSRWTILSVSRDRALDAMDNGVKLHLRAIGAAFEALDVPFEADELAHLVRIGNRGSYIRAVASKPCTARGMSDNLILDEFAHHQDSRAIWAALLPVVSRPDLKLRVISTPNGRGNKFYEIMTQPDGLFSRHVVTIYDAVAEGLPRNIEELRRAMADPIAWAQEFECQFVDEATAWLPFDLIDGCEDAASPGEYQGGPCYVGVDFAARGDLTVIAVLEEVGDVLWLRELLELRATSFAAQLAELDRVMRDYRVIRAALDQTGLGEMPVQEAQRRHGQYRVEGVLFSPARKLDMATALKERMEDRRIRLPQGHAALRADLHSVQRVAGPNGNPRLVAERENGSHADRFWALALACSAAAQPKFAYGYEPVGARKWSGRYDPALDDAPMDKWLYATKHGRRPLIRATGGVCHLTPQRRRSRSR
jgi:phage FluMu gp28-like protein